MKDLTFVPNYPDDTGWKRRHFRALREAVGFAKAMVDGLGAWITYAECHRRRYESQIGDDYVLGNAWANWGFALRDLLDGDCGELDCGTLCTIINDNLSEQGFNPDLRRRKEER